MKKLSLLVSGLALSTLALAQKPDASVPMSLEGQIGLADGGSGGTNLYFTAPSVRFRYFLADNIAARVTLGIGNSSSTTNYYETEDVNGGANGTAEAKSSSLNLSLGAEYHFEGTDKLSPFVGADIVIGSGKNTTDWTNYDGTQYTADFTRAIENKTSSFGINLVAGTDYYFAENFYLGLELGFAFRANTTKEGTDAVTTGGTTVTNTSNEAKGSSFSNTAIGTFRLGWRF